MRIGIDAFPLAGRIAGIGRYVLEICYALDEVMPEAEFFLYSPRPLVIDPPSTRWQMRVGGNQLASSYGWLKWSAGAMARADGSQVFWGTRTILPGCTDGFRTVSTVHDLNYRIFPKYMPYATHWAHRLWFARDVRRSDAVVTNSQGTADRLLDLIGVEASAVVRPGVADFFVTQMEEVVGERLSALNVRKPYFLTAGTIEPRKNLPRLVEAFISLKQAGELSGYELLIVGGRGWRDRRLRALFSEEWKWGVRWMGFVSDEDLAALYSGSAAFVFPSLYEGFGIPVIEARACGARVVVSDMPELRESGGKMGIYIEPTLQGIRQGLLRAKREGEVVFRETKLPSWREAASTMADVFRRVHGGIT